MALAPPAFQFYAGDFLVSVTTMTNAQVGAYIRLLSHQWVNGGVPPDLKLISKIVHETVPRTGRLMDAIRSKFVLYSDGLLKNRRLEEVRAKQLTFNKLQAAKAKKGGRPRRLTKNPRVLRRHNPNESSPISDLRSSVQKYKNAAAPPTRVPHPVEKPKVSRLAALVREEVLPLGIVDEGDRMEVAKQLAAKHKLPYTSRAIASALASAQAQLAKGIRYDS